MLAALEAKHKKALIDTKAVRKARKVKPLDAKPRKKRSDAGMKFKRKPQLEEEPETVQETE